MECFIILVLMKCKSEIFILYRNYIDQVNSTLIKGFKLIDNCPVIGKLKTGFTSKFTTTKEYSMTKLLRNFLLALCFFSSFAYAGQKELVEYKWKSGNAAICITPIDPQRTEFGFEGQGFLPNETLEITSISSGETLNLSLNADEKGSFQAGMSPVVIGKDGGNGTIIVKRKNNAESGTLNYTWGNVKK